jgi:hypothetical protein
VRSLVLEVLPLPLICGCPEKTEDNLFVDIHFIDKQWQWHHKHIGIISCKDISTCEEIAPRIKTIMEEYDMLYIVAAMVKDGWATWQLPP